MGCGSSSGSNGKRILMLGLDGAGKTALLYKMVLGEVVTTIPTIGFNVEQINVDGTNLVVWDVGGQANIRSLWNHYTKDTDGLMFVIDSSNKTKLDDAKTELQKLISHPHLKGVPVVVIANKQDLEDAMPISELSVFLGLMYLEDNVNIETQGASVTTGQGLQQCFKSMVALMKKYPAMARVHL